MILFIAVRVLITFDILTVLSVTLLSLLKEAIRHGLVVSVLDKHQALAGVITMCSWARLSIGKFNIDE